MMWSKSSLICSNKEAKENSAKLRKKHILYLTLDFLQGEGYFKTADCLIMEAQLTDDFKVCDNVSLDIILQEYANYFQLKFSRQPSICKKIEKDCKNLVKLTKPTENKTVKICNSTQAVDEVHTDEVDFSDAFQIRQLSSENFDSNKKIIDKPMDAFMASVPNDSKEWIEQIYKEAKTIRQETKWDDIKGLDNAKLFLREASTDSLKYPDFYSGLSAPWKSILLYGPPGGGKTMLAKALAHESQRIFFNVSPGNILSKWRGESEKNIKILFNLARYHSPSVIFIDEIEALTSVRDHSFEHEASRRMKSEILSELDGINGNMENVLFLGTSNLPWEIDDALLRRMEKRIYIPLPNFECRQEIFKSKINNSNCNLNEIDYKILADHTEGYSGSDIHTICREAAMLSVRRLLNKNKDNSKPSTKNITQSDLTIAISKIKPAIRNRVNKYEEWSLNNGAE